MLQDCMKVSMSCVIVKQKTALRALCLVTSAPVCRACLKLQQGIGGLFPLGLVSHRSSHRTFDMQTLPPTGPSQFGYISSRFLCEECVKHS